MSETPTGRAWLAWLAVMILVAAVALAAFVGRSHARDLGQWEAADPAVRAWYRDLKQPDHPESSCCGEADAYWCDEIHVREGKTFCTITDDRPDEPRGRPHIALGTDRPPAGVTVVIEPG